MLSNFLCQVVIVFEAVACLCIDVLSLVTLHIRPTLALHCLLKCLASVAELMLLYAAAEQRMSDGKTPSGKAANNAVLHHRQAQTVVHPAAVGQAAAPVVAVAPALQGPAAAVPPQVAAADDSWTGALIAIVVVCSCVWCDAVMDVCLMAWCAAVFTFEHVYRYEAQSLLVVHHVT